MRLRGFALLFALTIHALAVHGGTREVFVSGRDHALWSNAFDGASWSGWLRVGGEINASPDAIAGPGFVEVFALGRDKSIVHVRRTFNVWGNWASLGGELDGPPAAVRLGSGDVHVFALGTDAQIWHVASRGGRWGGWEPIGGEFPPAVRPAAADLGGGRMEVFARGKDHRIWSQQFDGSNWTGWNPVNEGIVVGDPAVAVLPSVVEVIALGTDRRLWHSNRGPATGEQWSTWGVWDGERFDAGHNPDAATDGAEIVAVLRGMDDAVRVRTSAGWANIGGEIGGDPAVVATQAGLARESTKPAPAAVSGVYRLTINGFIVHRETNDDPLERDGARDEVFIKVGVDTAGEPRQEHLDAMTRTFGDVHNNPTRIRAGSARGAPGIGADGGFMTGDSFPTRTPWLRATEPARPREPADGELIDVARQGVSRLPMIAWEGTLVRGGNAVLITPAIIEKDQRIEESTRETRFVASQVAGQFSQQLLGVTAESEPTLSRAIADAIASRVRYPRGPDPGDRPIGMQLRGENYVWRTSPIILTYELAEGIVARPGEFTDMRRGADGTTQSIAQPLPAGVRWINFRDAGDLGGDYTLFWQLEKIR